MAQGSARRGHRVIYGLGGMGTSLVDRARRLFEFLRSAQRLRTSPVRSVESYEREGLLLWFSELPQHPVVRVERTEQDDLDQPLIVVDRVPRVDPPEPQADLVRWLTSPLDDPEKPPALRKQVRDDDEDGEPRVLKLDDVPGIEEQFRLWFSGWEEWAEQERVDAPVRQLYSDLYSTYINATESPEEFELIIGVAIVVYQIDPET